MVFVVIVAGMGVCMVQLHTSQSRRQEIAIDKKCAIYVTEAGLSEAFLSVAQGKSGNIASAEEPALVGDCGVYWVEATELPEGQVALQSTGLSGRGRFSIGTVLQRQKDPVASLGIYAVTNVTVGKNSILDGYTSTDGSFDSQVDATLGNGSTGIGARIQAGTDIVLSGAAGGVMGIGVGGTPSGTTVYGDASPGTNGTVSIGSGVTVTGSTSPSLNGVELPEIEVPEVPEKDDLVLGLLEYSRVSASERYHETLTVPAGRTLPISGPMNIVIGEFTLEVGATLEIDATDGPVTIYVTEHLLFNVGSVVENVTEDPSGLVLMITADEWRDFDQDRIADNPVEFFPDGKFYGYIYAPTVDFDLSAATHLIGGVAANSVTLADGSRVTFDAAMTTKEVAVSRLPLQVAWQVLDIPDEPICSSRKDPISYLDGMGVVPVASSAAHEEKFLDVTYFKSDGTVDSYSGLASGVNWSDVDQVVDMLWDDDAVVDSDDGQKSYTPLMFSSKNLITRETAGKAKTP